MAKRFTDTDKWKKPFLRSMKAPYKLLWLYILDECDHAGIWQVDLEVAEIKIGEKLNIEKALEQFSGRIEIISGGDKWFIPDFIDFQYGVLNPENRAHNSVISILVKYNLVDELNKIKPLTSPLQGAMDKDKDKDKDKELDSPKILKEETVREKYIRFIKSFNEKANKNYRGDGTSERQFSARLKDGFTVEEMIKALEAALKDNYHIETNGKYLTPEFFTRADKIEKFLNAKPVIASVKYNIPKPNMTGTYD